jgi:hypothetical protein
MTKQRGSKECGSTIQSNWHTSSSSPCVCAFCPYQLVQAHRTPPLTNVSPQIAMYLLMPRLRLCKMQRLGYHVLNRRKPFESESNGSWGRKRKSQRSPNGVTMQARVAGKGIRLSRTILGIQPLYEKVKIDGSGVAKTWKMTPSTAKSATEEVFPAPDYEVPSPRRRSMYSCPLPAVHFALRDAEQYNFAMRHSSKVPFYFVSALAKMSLNTSSGRYNSHGSAFADHFHHHQQNTNTIRLSFLQSKYIR